MNDTPIAKQVILTLEVDAEKADTVADWIQSVWGIHVVQLLRPGHPRTWLELYFPSDIKAEIAREVLTDHDGVRAAQIRQTTPRDWESFWRHHFHTQDIGARLRICPVWEQDRQPEDGRVTVLINPGLSFGTGDHFTTRFCLEMIDQLCQKFALASLLDVGTGSGILAIAAARLGCGKVLGLDNDAQCVEQARENAALNGVSGRIEWQLFDIARDSLPGAYDVVCANLFSDMLIGAAPSLARAARSKLILSGIRETQMDGVAESYIAQGGREVVRDGDGEWGGIMFEMEKRKET